MKVAAAEEAEVVWMTKKRQQEYWHHSTNLQ